MTDLEKAVASSLRITQASAEYLLPEIQRNISIAEAELIRSGITDAVVSAGGSLIQDAIIAFCMVRMGEEKERTWYEEVFRTQQDNIRKSIE